jgi:hypothetical protein
MRDLRGREAMTVARSVVFQSYRTHDVPAWIQRCQASVKQWAGSHGHDYRFLGDEFLELAPAWYRAKAGDQLCPITDLSRLLYARQLLAQGYDLAIWIDADTLVFRPDELILSLPQGFAFTREVWTGLDRTGHMVTSVRVNNSITLFARNNQHLDFFIDACLRIARASPRLGKLDVGTHFLTGLRAILPFPLVRGVATLGPMLLRNIARGESRDLEIHARAQGHRVVCANLCASMEGDGQIATRPTYDKVIERLLESRGGVLNRYLANPVGVT